MPKENDKTRQETNATENISSKVIIFNSTMHDCFIKPPHALANRDPEGRAKKEDNRKTVAMWSLGRPETGVGI